MLRAHLDAFGEHVSMRLLASADLAERPEGARTEVYRAPRVQLSAFSAPAEVKARDPLCRGPSSRRSPGDGEASRPSRVGRSMNVLFVCAGNVALSPMAGHARNAHGCCEPAEPVIRYPSEIPASDAAWRRAEMREIAPRITVDQGVRFGRPVIRGTRVPVDLVIAKLAGGMATEEVAQEYGLEREDVLAALAYAARTLAEEQVRAVG